MINNLEKSLLRKIAHLYQRDNNQINNLFESDSEILKIGKHFFCFSIDEFSAEDYFLENNPYLLGRNLASASLTDIYASGGRPKFVLQSLVINQDWQEEFVILLNQGISNIYNQKKVKLLGGDFGINKQWHFTSTVIGDVIKPILRSGAKAMDYIFVSEKIGSGNLAAAKKLLNISWLEKSHPWHIKINQKKIALIQKYATACIDTSDGLLNALLEIASNSQTGFLINQVPFINGANLLAKFKGLSLGLLMFGEAGEYAFCFTVSPLNKEFFINDAKKYNYKFYLLGQLQENNKLLIKINNNLIDLKNYNLSARNYKSKIDYLNDLNQWLRKVENG